MISATTATNRVCL